MRPSELAGIGCEWCAFCLDEALLARERAKGKRELEELEAEREQARERARLDMMRREAIG